MRMGLGVLVFYTASLLGLAKPTPREGTYTAKRLSQSDVSAYTPYAYFAAAAYCHPNITSTWSCEHNYDKLNCQSTKGFIPIDSGGDGSGVQFWYVGYYQALHTIIIGHQGTDNSHFQAVWTDLLAFRTSLDRGRFPDPHLNSSVGVHHGFAKEQGRTAGSILSAVKTGIKKYNATQVTVVGHSLGGALALLDSVYLPLHLTKEQTAKPITFKTVTFGMPRVGNAAFASYVDAQVHAGKLDLTHINNKRDPIPNTPPAKLGFRHPSGEVHITTDGTWMSCSGEENPSKYCAIGAIRSRYNDDDREAFHDGPYGKVRMSCG